MRLSDLTPLAGLINLTTLELEGDSLSDLRPLARLTGLRWLGIRGDALSELMPLGGVDQAGPCGDQQRRVIGPDATGTTERLGSLEISSNALSDLTPLAGLINLTTLELEGDSLSDLRPLAGPIQLLERAYYTARAEPIGRGAHAGGRLGNGGIRSSPPRNP